MRKLAFIYPGQGAQNAGMGADFYENSSAARELFDKAEEALELDLKKICFEEPLKNWTLSAWCEKEESSWSMLFLRERALCALYWE